MKYVHKILEAEMKVFWWMSVNIWIGCTRNGYIHKKLKVVPTNASIREKV